jgi:phosphotransacetylase
VFYLALVAASALDRYAYAWPRRPRPAPQVKGDVNTFGVMMVATGDAEGMVSGAVHTTAATIRPAMQVGAAAPRP